ncbi:MAG: dihydrofolate reductase family protein [Bacteroidetes bacterium]|nr:dihydrofolate reductase family protein [Bacteroidota bacterium]
MRKLIYVINLSIDGCLDHTIGVPDEELFDFYIDLVRNAGTFVYGRTTYDLMVPYWPDIAKNPAGQTKADVEFAEAFDAVEKVVFSRSLEKAEGKNSRIVRTKAEDEIRKLKQEEGRNIYVGGVALPSYLIGLGLVDEFIFTIMPVIAGKGRRLMEGIGMPEKLGLNLVDTKISGSGSVILHYVKRS